MLNIALFGNPEVTLNEQPVKVSRRRSRALLYYLAASSSPVRRESLLALLWPETGRLSAQQLLRTALHGLRVELGNVLVSDGETVSLAPSIQVDVQVFEQLIAQSTGDVGALQKAFDLYRGEFIEGFYLPDSTGFEDWLAINRERYRRLALQTAHRLAQHFEAAGDYKTALSYLQRALDTDPLQEDLQREAIRMLYLSGDRPGAIRRYDHVRRLLEEEMGVPPMNETRQLYDAILNDRLSPPTAVIAPPLAVPAPQPENPANLPFIGRQTELEALHRLSTSHQLILIEGETGVGKTRLAFEYLRADERLPLIGVAHELERNMPYQPITEALRSLTRREDWPSLRSGIQLSLPPVWLEAAAYLLPELSPQANTLDAHLRPPEEPRLWESVHRVILALGKLHPLVLLIDDLHWADVSTLGLLGYLVRQTGSSPMMFMATTRAYSPRSPLTVLIQTLSRGGLVAHIELGRLTKPEIAGATRALAPDFAPPLAAWLEKNSEGNPFVMAELVRYARSKGILQPDGIVNLSALSDSPVVPQGVYSLIQSRLALVSDSARRILEAAAAAGREFEFDIVTRAAGISESASTEAFNELQTAGFIHPLGGSRYAFDHSLIVEVLLREMGEPRKHLMHRRVAEAMESLFNPTRLAAFSGVIAGHYREGNAPERASPYAIKAGQQAANLGAWKEAVSFYDQALEGLSDESRLPVLMALGDARLRASRSVEAADAYREAIHIAQTLGQMSLFDAARLGLCQALLSQSRYDEVIDLVQQVIATGRPESRRDAEFLWGTVLSLEGADLDEAAHHLQAADMLCKELAPPNPVLLARIRFELGSLAAQQGDLEKAVELYRQALAMACPHEQDEFLVWCILAHNNLGYHLLLLGDPQAVDYAQEGMRLAQEKGMLGQQPYLYSTLGEIYLDQGSLDQAEEYFQKGLALSEQLSIQERIAGLTANLGLVAVRRGQTALAVHRLSLALARAEGLRTLHLAAQIRLWLAPLLPYREALSHLEIVRAYAASSGRKRLLSQVETLFEEVNARKGLNPLY